MKKYLYLFIFILFVFINLFIHLSIYLFCWNLITSFCAKSHFSPQNPSLGKVEVQYVETDFGRYLSK